MDYPAVVLYALRPDFVTLGVKDVIYTPCGFSFVVGILLDGVEYAEEIKESSIDLHVLAATLGSPL